MKLGQVRLVAAAAAALTLSACDYIPVNSYRTASTAMEPAIQPGRFLVAWRVNAEDLKRGDVVVVDRSGDAWLMRIAALPGDRIAMVNGQVVLNGSAIEQRPLGNYTVEGGQMPQEYAMYEEQFPGEAKPHRVLDIGRTLQDDTPEVAVPQGSYFLLGDNRDNARDSRVADDGLIGGLGLVEAARITGRINTD